MDHLLCWQLLNHRREEARTVLPRGPLYLIGRGGERRREEKEGRGRRGGEMEGGRGGEGEGREGGEMERGREREDGRT